MYGGHIGDGIRPSERRKRYGTLIIKLALLECKKLGINNVLITCKKIILVLKRLSLTMVELKKMKY